MRAVIIFTCVAGVGLVPSHAFLHTPVARGDNALTQHHLMGHQRATLRVNGTRPTLSRLRMAKKKGDRRKKKKASSKAERGASGGGPLVANVESVAKVVPSDEPDLKDLNESGPLGRGAGFGASIAQPGELLPEGVPGTDAAREAKVEETLRKMGVQSASDTKLTDPTSLEAKKAEIRRMGERINSIFDLIPAEVQLGMERVFTGGFVICLLFFVSVGLSIAVEAYFKSTTGEMPQELDDFIVQNMQPYFTPSLVAVFVCSVSLGILKIGQMGQEDVIYKEDD